MPLDATPAGADANSYLTVAQADALAGDDFGPEREGWLNAGVEPKEQALKRATREIEGYLVETWVRYSAEQPRAFPRSTDVVAGLPVIPSAVQRATYEQATFLLRNQTVLDDAATRKARELQSASEPNMSYTLGRSDLAVLCDAARFYLYAFRKGATGSAGLRSVHIDTEYVPTGLTTWDW